jgi:hypothetical protein
VRILACGDRNYPVERRTFLWAVLDGLLGSADQDEEVVLIEGQCPSGGADQFAEDWARALAPRVIHLPFPADWKRFGRRAGPIRNVAMLEQGRPTIVVAFHDDLASSKGTKHMVEIVAAVEGLPVYVVSSPRS